MIVSPLVKTVTDVFSNKTRQPWSQSGPIPIILQCKLGIRCPLVTGIGRFTSQEAEEQWGGPP